MGVRGAILARVRLRLVLAAGVLIAAALLFAASAPAALLQTDGFSDGDALNCQVGFVAGESAASSFVPPPADLPARIESVQVLGCNETVNVDLEIFEDGLDADPQPDGESLWSTEAPVSLAPGFLDHSVADENIVINGGIRVAVTGIDSGVRLVADSDPIVAQRNTILAIGGWSFAEIFLVPNNYVIRATYTPSARVTLTSKPKKKIRTNRRRVLVTFRFTATILPADFECKIDAGAFRDCSSPALYRVGRGKHRFQARATHDNLTGKPAGYSFRVVKR